MRGKGGIIGGIITLVIGGTLYQVNQADIVNYFSKDTGLTKQEAEKYVSEVKEDDLVPYDQLGTDYISDGQDMVKAANEIDCENYEYEWESYTLKCDKGKTQLRILGNNEIALGKAYKSLASDDAGREEISLVIRNIDTLNSSLSFEVVNWLLEPSDIDDIRKTNSYNKALLQAALDSE